MCPKHTFRRKSRKCSIAKPNFSMRFEIARRPTGPGVGGGAKGPLGVASKANRGEALCFHLPGTSLIATEVVARPRVSLRTCGAGDQPVTESGLRAGEI